MALLGTYWRLFQTDLVALLALGAVFSAADSAPSFGGGRRPFWFRRKPFSFASSPVPKMGKAAVPMYPVSFAGGVSTNATGYEAAFGITADAMVKSS